MAGIIRARTGDLPGALAALQEAMARQHADGYRLFLGMTLEVAAVVLARIGEAEPAAELRTPELADLREATRTDDAGINRAESAGNQVTQCFCSRIVIGPRPGRSAHCGRSVRMSSRCRSIRSASRNRTFWAASQSGGTKMVPVVSQS